MTSLDAKDFTVAWLDSRQFYFTTGNKLPDGYEICIEPCMSGWDVALYQNGEIVGDKICTKSMIDIEEMVACMEHGEPSMVTGKHLEALVPALEKANEIFNRSKLDLK